MDAEVITGGRRVCGSFGFPDPRRKITERSIESGDKIDFQSSVPFGKCAECPRGPFDFPRFRQDAHFAGLGDSLAERARDVNQNVRGVLVSKRVAMHSHAECGGQFRGDAQARQRHAVVTRKGAFLLVGIRAIESATVRYRGLGGAGNHQKIPAVGGACPRQSRVAEPQDAPVRVVVARRVGRSIAQHRNRIRTEPHHAERHGGPRKVVAAQIGHAPGPDEGIHVASQRPRLDRGIRFRCIDSDGNRRQELMDRQSENDQPEKTAIPRIHRTYSQQSE